MQVLLVVAGLSLLVLWHELGHALCARGLKLRITNVSIGLGPAVLRRVWGGIDVVVGLMPFGGFVRVAELTPEADDPERFRARKTMRRFAVIVAGSAANFVLAAVLMTVVASTWGRATGRIEGLEVTAASEEARAGGLRVGDVVVQVNGSRIDRVSTLQRALASSEPVATVEVQRDGSPALLHVRTQERKGRHGLGARYVVRDERERVSWWGAVSEGAVYPVRQSARLLENARMMFVPDAEVRPMGPLGLADRVARSGAWDARRVLSFAALLSVVVGLFNLFPAPGLDGGRALLEGLEAVMRRRIAPRIATIVQVVGVVILLVIWVAVFASDMRAWVVRG